MGRIGDMKSEADGAQEILAPVSNSSSTGAMGLNGGKLSLSFEAMEERKAA